MSDDPKDRVEPELVPSPDRLPGQRDGLPPGALGGMPADPQGLGGMPADTQGDENRDPPANAPDIPA